MRMFSIEKIKRNNCCIPIFQTSIPIPNQGANLICCKSIRPGDKSNNNRIIKVKPNFILEIIEDGISKELVEQKHSHISQFLNHYYNK
jgi:hypothetical protein